LTFSINKKPWKVNIMIAQALKPVNRGMVNITLEIYKHFLDESIPPGLLTYKKRGGMVEIEQVGVVLL
jgi:hypothetical protein